MYLSSHTKLAQAFHRRFDIDTNEALVLIESHVHGGHDSQTHRLVVVNGVGHVVPNKVADEMASLRARLGSLQRELSDRVKAENRPQRFAG